MSSHPFGVEASPGRLHVAGEVDLAVAAELLDAIFAAGSTGASTILVVDLSEVTFLDSTGIGAMIQGAQRLADIAVELRVESPNPFVAKTLEMAGVGELLRLTTPA